MKNIIKSRIIPIPRSDIDTDLIIPAEFLTTTVKEGLGRHLFARLRIMETDFPLNLKKYQEAQIMVTRENFGCGSSREHAAWALKDYGIDVVIAPSFSDIFFSNALKNGVLPIVLSEKNVNKIFDSEKKIDNYELKINVKKQTVILPDSSSEVFEIDPYRKECLLKNMDDLSYLMANIREIHRFDKKHAKNIYFNTNAL